MEGSLENHISWEQVFWPLGSEPVLPIPVLGTWKSHVNSELQFSSSVQKKKKEIIFFNKSVVQKHCTSHICQLEF